MTPDHTEKETGQGASLTGSNVYAVATYPNRVTDEVKRDADRHFMRWLTTGIDYHRRLARAAADALRKR